MLITHPIIYVMSMQAMARYFREEGIPAWRLPDLVTHDDSILDDVLSVVRLLRRVWATHRPVAHHSPRSVQQGAAAR